MVCSAFSLAREDPFTPVISPKDSIRPYYGETSVFDSAQIEFPSSARLIKKIEVTFQNIDGSIQTRSVSARGRIDWRMPLLISQVLTKNQIAQLKNIDNKTPPPSQISPTPKKTMVKSIDIPAVESKETIKKESVDSARTMRIAGNTATAQAQDLSKIPSKTDSPKIDSRKADSPKIYSQNTPQVQIISKPRKVASPQNVAKSAKISRVSQSNFVPYTISGNSIFVSYVGRLKRHYIMQNPYRIVMDFDINTKYYKKNSYSINQPYFKRLRYGLHTNFLRIVLELDGNYIYNLEKYESGVKINVQ